VDFLLFGQQPNLNRWRERPFSTGAERGPTAKSAQDVYERVVAEEGPGVPADAGPYSRVAAAILRYDVFPRRILRPELAHDLIGLGDVVGGVSPFAPGIRIFFASRVVDLFDDELNGVWRTGFTYRTLQGHPCILRFPYKAEGAWQIVVILGLGRPLLSRIATPCFP
jgi:hypothetical protein